MRIFTTSVLALGLAITGCGGDDGDGGSGGSAGSAGAAGAGTGGTAGGGAGGSAGGAAGSGASGGTGGSASTLCQDIQGHCADTAAGTCAEYGGTRSDDTFKAYQEGCTQEQKTWGTGPCPRDSAFGACLFDFSGPCSAVIYSPPATEADAQQNCTTSQGVWTTP